MDGFARVPTRVATLSRGDWRWPGGKRNLPKLTRSTHRSCCFSGIVESPVHIRRLLSECLRKAGCLTVAGIRSVDARWENTCTCVSTCLHQLLRSVPDSVLLHPAYRCRVNLFSLQALMPTPSEIATVRNICRCTLSVELRVPCSQVWHSPPACLFPSVGLFLSFPQLHCLRKQVNGYRLVCIAPNAPLPQVLATTATRLQYMIASFPRNPCERLHPIMSSVLSNRGPFSRSARPTELLGHV